MSENIDKVLQREEKVEILVKKTAKLDSIADEIKKSVTSIINSRLARLRNSPSGQSISSKCSLLR